MVVNATSRSPSVLASTTSMSAESIGRCLYLGCIGVGVRIAGIDKQRDCNGRGEQLVQDFQALWSHSTKQNAHPGEVAARSAETLDEARRDWIGAGEEDNRRGFGCGLCCKCRRGVES